MLKRYLCLAVLTLLVSAGAPAPQETPSPGPFDKTVKPVLAKSCYGCHNQKLKSGDLDLMSLNTAESVATHTEEWEKVATRVLDGTMPPKGAPRPSQADVETIAKWIKEEVNRVELAQKPDPGRVTARRLNRAEYNNTIRDLLSVDLKLADDFPQDDSGYGFDNIGDVLSLSPVLLEKYLKAAEVAVRTAVHGAEKLKPMVLRAQPPRADLVLLPKPEPVYDETGLSMPNALHATMRFPADGVYTFRAALEGRRPNGSEPLHIGLWIDGKLSSTIEIDAPSDGASIDLFGAQGETKMFVTAGEHWVAGTLLKLYEGLPPSYEGPNPSKRPIPPGRTPRPLQIPPDATPEQIAKLKKEAERRAQQFRVPANRVWVHFVEALGPFDQKIAPPTESRKRIFTCGHADGKHVASCDRQIVAAVRAPRIPQTGHRD